VEPGDFTSIRAGQVIRVPNLGGYFAFVPTPLPPAVDWEGGLVASLSEADRAISDLAGTGRNLPNPHLLILPFVRHEAVLSSRIEGTQTTLRHLYEYEIGKPTLFEPPRDVREVYNYVRALDHGLSRLDTLPVSLRLLCEIHAKLMEGVRGERLIPGDFRREQNLIGAPGDTPQTASFVPPPAPQMREALDAFEKFLHARSDLPPLARIGVIHYQFEAIHPFSDGNGRIGRLLITLLLCAWGLLPQPLLYLSAYFEARRQQYYDALMAVSRQGAWERWLTFFLEGVALQAHDAIERARRLLDLRESYRQMVKAPRAPARFLAAIDELFIRPVLTVTSLADAASVGYQVANRYLRQLEMAGMVRETTGRRRNRVYVAEDILRAIEEPLSPPDSS
jgi:Fic family protein